MSDQPVTEVVEITTTDEPEPVVHDSFLSIGGRRSFLSVGSVGSICSIGSVGSAFSIGSVGSIFSVGSIASFASVGSAFASLSWFTIGKRRKKQQASPTLQAEDAAPAPQSLVRSAVQIMRATIVLLSLVRGLRRAKRAPKS